MDLPPPLRSGGLVRAALASAPGEVVVADFASDTSSGGAEVILATPVVSGTETLGVLAARLRFEDMAAVLGGRAPTQGIELYVFESGRPAGPRFLVQR